jgi:serine/threonine protein kinase
MFLAPEIRSKTPEVVTTVSDIWSVGAICYLLITGGHPDKKSREKFNFKESIWK